MLILSSFRLVILIKKNPVLTLIGHFVFKKQVMNLFILDETNVDQTRFMTLDEI